MGTYDHNYVKHTMFNHGLALSQKFKQYPAWDNYVEPLIVRQSAILFTAGNSFIKGMISDNKNKDDINTSLADYTSHIKQELEEFKE